MPNLLKNADLSPLTNVDETAQPSLAQLLLSEEAYEALVVKRAAEQASAKTTKSSRSARLSRTRSASTSTRGQVSAGMQKSEQLRKEKKQQEEAKKRLEQWQLQEGAKHGGSTQAPALNKKKDTSSSLTETKENSLIINEKLRPVVFGLLDFMPTVDSSGNSTVTGDIMSFNRAIKVLNAEHMPDDAKRSNEEGSVLTLQWLDEYTQYVNMVEAFLTSLDANNFTFLDDMLSFLAIQKESSTTCSNTQLLITILRDYAVAVENCSPRLFETEEREIPTAGPVLPPKLSGIDAVRAVLKSSTAFDYLGAVLGDDQERALKVLLYQISSELKLSYNTSKYGSSGTAASLLQTPATTSTIIPSKVASMNSMGLKQFLPGDASYSFLFPFERRDILPDDSNIKFDSAPDLVSREESIGSTAPTTTYTKISSQAKTAFSQVAALLDTDDFSSDYAPSVGAFILIAQNVTLPLLELLGKKSPARRDIIEFIFLALAADNEEVLAQLLLFLAALKEELARPSTESSLGTAQRAKVVGSLVATKEIASNSKFDFQQSKLDTAIAPSPVQATTTVVSTKVSSFAPLMSIGSVGLMSPTPKSGGMSLKKSTTTTAVTSTLANAGSSLVKAVTASAIVQETAAKADGLRVAAVVQLDPTVTPPTTTTQTYSTAWSDICSATAALLLEAMTGVRSSGTMTGAVIPLGLREITDQLRSISTSAEDTDVFISLLTLFDDFLEMFASSEGDCISGSSTVYGGISRGNIEIAFFMCVCKIQYFISKNVYALSTNTTNSDSTDVKLDTTKLEDLDDALIDAFSGDIDLDSLAVASDSLGRVLESLIDEEADVATFPATFSEFLDKIGATFVALRDILDTDGDETVEGVQALRTRVEGGLPISRDLAMELRSFQNRYNSDIGSISETKTKDWPVDDVSALFLSNMLTEATFSSTKKVMAIAIPAGLCEAIYNVPVSLEDLSRSAEELSKTTFEVEIEKLDLTRPNLKFTPRVYSFARNVRINSFYKVSSGVAAAYYDVYTGEADPIAYNEGSLTESDKGLTAISFDMISEQINNLKIDQALKMYSSLLYDLNFSSTNHPIDVASAAAMKKKFISIPGAALLDYDGDEFLSGSNLAWDYLHRAIPSFDQWYKPTGGEVENQLNLDVDFKSDRTAFSLWEYLSSMGVLKFSSETAERLSLGAKFENVILIPFDVDSFEVDPETFGDNYESENKANASLTLAEEEVSIGLETSQGVDLATFRVTIRIPAEGDEAGEEKES